MDQNEPFLNIVNALLDENKPFPARFLHRFSDLVSEELKRLLEAWPQVSLHRKHTLLEDLEELSESDTLTSFDDLAVSLLTDPDPTIRVQAIRLLWECDDLQLIKIFLDILDDSGDIEEQAAAANALGRFVYLGELEKIPAGQFHEIEEKLINVTTSTKASLVRRRALESLGYSGREQVVPLIDSAYHQKDPGWMVSALFAMGRSCDERWKKQILSQMRSPDDDIRTEAIHAAGELELKSAPPIILDLLEDEEDLGVRRESIWALSKIGGEGVRAKLEELLEVEEDDDQVDFLEEALEILSFTEDMESFSLFDVDPEIEFIEEETDEED